MAPKSLFEVCALVGVVALASCAQAAVHHRAEVCPPRNVVTQFDLPRYLGTWYEIQKIPTVFERGGKCIRAIYSDNKNGTVEVRNSLINEDSGEFYEVVGRARFSGDPNEAKLAVIFPSAPFEAPYWVLSTNYNQYAIVWGCTDDTGPQGELLWYLSRSRNPDEGERLGVRILMEGLGLDISKLVVSDQTGCE